jgi:hypothetical protein
MATIEKRATSLNHVFLIDWHDDGILREIIVVMEDKVGAIYGIEVNRLHPIDKGRLKKVITSIHSDKYSLWQLLADSRLPNGMNALDFFHANYVKVKRPRGSIGAMSMGGTMADIQITNESDKVIGSGFTSGVATAAEPTSM